MGGQRQAQLQTSSRSGSTLTLTRRQTHRVDLVDPLASLVTLPSDPVAVEVGTDPVEDLAGEPVVLPLLRIKLQHTLVHQVLAVLQEPGTLGDVGGGVGGSPGPLRWSHLQQAGQVVLQELLESLVELQAHKLSSPGGGGLFGGFGRRHRAPALAGLVDAGTIIIYMSGEPDKDGSRLQPWTPMAASEAQLKRIRVELHVARLGHALPRVHLLDTSPQVVPDLVQTYLSESMRVLGPVRRHAGAPVWPGSSPLSATVPAPVSVGPARILSWVSAGSRWLWSHSESIWTGAVQEASGWF